MLMTAAIATALLFSGGAQATAEPAGPQLPPGFTSVAMKPSGSAQATLGPCTIVRFGYTGTASCEDMPGVTADWNQDRIADESFVIADGLRPRTIWHAWPNSGSWHEMPHGGRADLTWDALANEYGDHIIVVIVIGDGVGGYWCSTDPAGGAESWSRWIQC